MKHICGVVWFLILFTNSFSQLSFYKTTGHITDGGEGRCVAQCPDGGYFHAYYVYYSSRFIGCLTKLGCTGEKEWEKFYDCNETVVPLQLIPQSDNGCLISFSAREPGGSWQHVVQRVDGSGNTVWSTWIDMHPAGQTGNMVQAPGGNIYICGSIEVDSTGFTGTAIAKLSSSGSVLWIKHYADLTYHTPVGITMTTTGKIAVTGITGFNALPFSNLFVFTCDENGNFLNRKILITYYDDEPRGICSDSNGNIYITGCSYFLNTEWDIMLVKLDESLNVKFSKFMDGNTSQGDIARYIISTNDNGLALFGDAGGFNERNPMLVKMDTNGLLAWSKQYPISPLYTNYIFHGAQNNDGGFIMTGDARPITQFRVSPILKTSADGTSECYNSVINLTVRDEPLLEIDTLLLSYNVTDSIVTGPDLVMPTGLTTFLTDFCSNNLPCGEFHFEPDTLCPQSCWLFSATSSNSDSWNWTFAGGNPATSNNQSPPVICFDEPGPHVITLQLTNIFGSATYSQVVNGEINCPFHIPNIFTPNGDGINDLFEVQGVSSDFYLLIFNRWGIKIFESNGNWWDGTTGGDKKSPEGTYFYVLTVNGRPGIYRGTVTLLR
jgi:gliding motility-associated-like protein